MPHQILVGRCRVRTRGLGEEGKARLGCAFMRELKSPDQPVECMVPRGKDRPCITGSGDWVTLEVEGAVPDKANWVKFFIDILDSDAGGLAEFDSVVFRTLPAGTPAAGAGE